MGVNWSGVPKRRVSTSRYSVRFVGRGFRKSGVAFVYNMADMADCVMTILREGGQIQSISKDSGRVVRSERVWHELANAYEDAYLETHGGRLPF